MFLLNNYEYLHMGICDDEKLAEIFGPRKILELRSEVELARSALNGAVCGKVPDYLDSLKSLKGGCVAQSVFAF